MLPAARASILSVIERSDCCLAELGLTLAEGRSLLAKVQAELILKQVQNGSQARLIVGAVARP
ncbi:UNVERIFIED_ORG: hypothetical protein J2Y81_007754 [Paraburkholderia sediminicola]|nr:hypothetical protein [Paraburkholderia sediminicola]